MKANDRFTLIATGSQPGAHSIWTLEAASTWSKLHEVPPFPQVSPECTFECVGFLQEPLHVMYYDAQTVAPLKISITCVANPPREYVQAVLDFIDPKHYLH